jgi:hypothetical protein
VNVDAFMPCSAAGQEALGGRAGPRHRHRGEIRAACGLRHEVERERRDAREVVARLLVADIDQRLGRQRRDGGLDVRAGVSRAHRQLARLHRGEAGRERVVDQQAPDLLERHAARQLFDVDPAIAQRAAVAIGLGDLRGEGDDALEA